ncbi:MAG: hypothetical protein LBO67_08860 [Spirochaetaceae bacterium]|jgi:hypothetical protein|nr:hypothetical protein [Spirochaetaceae bacterium]
MTIREIAAVLEAEIVQNSFDDVQISSAYTSDLLSDVITHAKNGGALITIQAHRNTVAVATLVNSRVIIICNNRPLPEDMLAAAYNENIAILRTTENQFTVSGKLYAILEKQ